MATFPRISVVTSSFNQGRFIGRTIDSVLAQGYPNVEHIVVDNLSTDETPAVLAAHRHLRVIREPDSGQAEAINKGFRVATGDIFCFLNSDDTFLPGALHRVAREIDPARGRHVVMGRCVYIDEDDRPTGIEHPSAFLGHERVLEVWKGHWVPQPSTFWTRAAWQRCGPLDESEHLVLDFDLMCRLSRHYAFAFLDQPLATYRLHTQSKTCSNDPARVYDRATRVSRRYWGSPLGPRYWRMLWSLACHRLEERVERKRRAAVLTLLGKEARVRGKRWYGLGCLLASAALAPGQTLRRVRLLRWGRPRGQGGDLWRESNLSPRTLLYRGYTAAHPDGYVGPVFQTTFEKGPGQRWLHLEGSPIVGWMPLPLHVDVAVDAVPVGRYRLEERRPFALAIPVAELAAGTHRLEMRADSFVVIADYLGVDDLRPLAFYLGGLRLTGDEEVDPGRPLTPAGRLLVFPKSSGRRTVALAA